MIEFRAGVRASEFATQQSDLAITLAGVPLNFTRAYSSIDTAAAGDFGSAWRLLTWEPRIASNVRLTV